MKKADRKQQSRALAIPLLVVELAVTSLLLLLLLLLSTPYLQASENNQQVNKASKQKLLNTGRRLLHSMAGDDLSAYFGFQPNIEVINANVANAFALAPSTLLLSSELYRRVNNESELAFVIAHEIAHLVLHSRVDLTQSSELQREMEADAYAIKLLKQGGFDPSAGTKLLKRLAEIERLSASKAIESRLSSLNLSDS